MESPPCCGMTLFLSLLCEELSGRQSALQGILVRRLRLEITLPKITKYDARQALSIAQIWAVVCIVKELQMFIHERRVFVHDRLVMQGRRERDGVDTF